MVGGLHRAFAEHRELVAGRQGVDDLVIQIDGEARQPAALDGGGSSSIWTTPPGPISTRLSATSVPEASNSRVLVSVVSTRRRTIWRARSWDRSLLSSPLRVTAASPMAPAKMRASVWRASLALDQPVLIAAEIEQAADQDRQRQHVDRENAERQRREGAAVALRRRTPVRIASGRRFAVARLPPAGSVRAPLSASALSASGAFSALQRRQRPFKHRDSGNRRRTAFRSGRNRCLSP